METRACSEETHILCISNSTARRLLLCRFQFFSPGRCRCNLLRTSRQHGISSYFASAIGPLRRNGTKQPTSLTEAEQADYCRPTLGRDGEDLVDRFQPPANLRQNAGQQ